MAAVPHDHHAREAHEERPQAGHQARRLERRLHVLEDAHDAGVEDLAFLVDRMKALDDADATERLREPARDLRPDRPPLAERGA